MPRSSVLAWRTCALAWLVLVTATGLASAEPKKKVTLPTDKQNLHLYLLIGQSNMSGRGHVYMEDRDPNEQILALSREETWIFGVEPLHWDKPPGIVGVGPGRAFAVSMLAETSNQDGERVYIGLIPCAETGSSLSDWEKGGRLYALAVRRAKRAAKDGVIKGILFHQGETDAAKYTLGVTYGERLRRMVVDLRKDLGAGQVPFVCGKLSDLLPEDRFQAAGMVNQGLGELSKHVPLTDCVSVNGLTQMADHVHFNETSQRILGKRYAAAMRELQKKAARP